MYQKLLSVRYLVGGSFWCKKIEKEHLRQSIRLVRSHIKLEACAPSSALDAHTCRRYGQTLRYRVGEACALRLRRSSDDIIIQINDNFNYLVNLSGSDKTETLVVGGQEGIYPAKSCVDLATTIKAAKVFAELGTMERSVSWEREGIPEPVS